MRWKMPNGFLRWQSINQYKIKWDKKAPSKGAKKVKDFLKRECSNNIILEELRIPGTLFRADFVILNKKCVIEYQGGTRKTSHHDNYNPHFHKTRVGFGRAVQREMSKVEFFENNGFKVLEIYDEDFPLTREFFEANEIYI